MQNQKIINVTPATLTPAQHGLLNFICHLDAPEILKCLKATVDLALFDDRQEISREDLSNVHLVRELGRHIKAVKKEGKKPVLQVVPS